jgi:endonuclease/exonuclease/phosphatase (EEP) superfamily protein YafD
MEVPRTAVAGAVMQRGFHNAFLKHPDRTTSGSFLERGRPIDWIFMRGPVRSDQAFVHSSVSASDHFPLSAQLAFT